jgi:hypothetical protein
MIRFYQPDLGSEPDSPFARDATISLFGAVIGWTRMIGRLLW